MASQRRAIRNARGCQFAKMLGTGSGETFSVRDADLRRWAIIASWDSLANARIFTNGPLVDSWDTIAKERAAFVLRPIATRGRWSGRSPFEPLVPAQDGPVVSITRARVRLTELQRFAGFVPPVAAAVTTAPGLIMRTGIGEAPVGLQGTFSMWQSATALTDFAYGPAHRLVIEETQRSNWYAEELFARFTVVRATGAFAGRSVEFNGPQ